ncbi:preprotein translocase subunit SecA [Candidatus Microgenomates bacterium]|nr:preprotein translocase subunit SecA [Candidatus Microgenomates bacterium]
MLSLKTLFDTNQREITRLSRTAQEINSLEIELQKLKESEFAAKTAAFRERIENGTEPQTLLPEAFALVRAASVRSIGLRHFDVQLVAAAALYEGKVAEQKTGEGKTLSAVPALYLHALSAQSVHLVTVNDYLARRDAGWMGPIFHLLGLSVGVIIQEGKSLLFDPEYNDPSHGDERLSHLRPVTRKEAYEADIVYGTNNEFGFDYLRDNMSGDIAGVVQRGHHFAIVDEVDSILIDEARTPLIISAPDTEPTDKYYEFARLIEKLSSDTDFQLDEKTKTAHLTEHGIVKVEKLLGVTNLYERDFETIHHLENALRAKTLYLRDRDYVVRDNEVIIVDEFTGRLMFGRRWSDGLHQAVEAKEGATIQQESRTLATITFQNYFRMYERLAGMTGTAATEAEEFHKIYGLEVMVIPTHRPMIRKDYSDGIYKTLRAKYSAVTRDIEEMHRAGQPVLVGTTSIEKNEIISEFLKRKKVPHQMLNAKHHEQEASIIAQAGKKGAVTVATNIAGRGVDIILGGTPPAKVPGMIQEQYEKTPAYKRWLAEHEEVVKRGGLHVIGTERHEARRIDNQLRGRSGRQGDPGSSRFYLSLEDDLMRIFGGEQISSLMTTLRIPEDQPIENKLVSRAIEQAQVKVEGFHFDARKRLVEYDDVINQQREIIYKKRREILEGKPVTEEMKEKLTQELSHIVELGTMDGADYEGILVSFLEIVPFDDQSQKQLLGTLQKLSTREEITQILERVVADVYKTREQQVGEEMMRQIERFAYMAAIDRLWMEHIDAMDDLREGIALRGYGQRDPLVEYKQEAYSMFERLMAQIDAEVVRRLFRIQVRVQPQPVVPPRQIQTNIDTTDMTGLRQNGSKDRTTTPKKPEEMTPEELDTEIARLEKEAGNNSTISPAAQPDPAAQKKLGRNDPCWCGSGKKWKKCHYPQTA